MILDGSDSKPQTGRFMQQLQGKTEQDQTGKWRQDKGH